MKVTKVEATWYQAPFAHPIENSLFQYRASNKVVVRVHTDDGLVGTGWTNGTGPAMVIAHDMGERILGRDPLARDRTLALLADDKTYGRGGLSAKARSAIDIALWDLAGQASGLSLHRMLGARHERVGAYVAGGYYSSGKDPRALADEAIQEISSGARAFKLKVGRLSVPEDLARVAVVRDAIGHGIRLLVDANGGYDRVSAREMGRGLADLGVFWFEEPIDSRDIEGQVELKRTVGVPIASGESEHSRHDMRRAIGAGAMDFVNADAQCIDGVTGWLEAASMAAAGGIAVAPHGDQEVHVHLAAAAQAGVLVEFYQGVNALRESMFEEKLELQEDGTVIPPDRPGLGFVLDEERLLTLQQAQLVAAA